MNALTARIAEDFARAAPPRDSATAERRRAALGALTRAGLPTSRDENWKYANLRALERLRFAPPAALPGAHSLAGLPAPIADFSRYVFVDGCFAPQLSSARARRSPIWPPRRRRHATARARSVAREQRFALLNDAFASDGALLHIAPGQTQRLELIFVARAAASAGASYPRLEVRLEPGAQLELIERHVSATPEGSFVNSALRRAAGARRAVDALPAAGSSRRESTLFDTLSASLAARASVRAAHGEHRRTRGTLDAIRATRRRARRACHGERGPGAPAAGAGYVRAGGASRAAGAHPATVPRHRRRPRPRRLQRQDRGRPPGAVGTDSQQSLRGLLAGAEAEIDLRPQLEIYTDEVRCSHGATTGKLDENMLFYLLARGLERDTAQRLLKWAFLADAFARIEVPELRHQIEEHLAQVLMDRTLQELL